MAHAQDNRDTPLHGFEDAGLTQELVNLLLDEHQRITVPRLERLWTYYRNPDDVSRSQTAFSQFGAPRPAKST